MNSTIIQYLFDENRININGAAAAAKQPPSQTNRSLNIWSIFNPKTPMESVGIILQSSLCLTKIRIILGEQQPFKEALSIDTVRARTSARAPLFASTNLAAFSDE